MMMTGWMEKRIKAEKIYVQVAVAGVIMKIKKSSRGSLEDERKKMAKVLKQKFLEGVAKKDGTAWIGVPLYSDFIVSASAVEVAGVSVLVGDCRGGSVRLDSKTLATRTSAGIGSLSSAR